MFFLFAESILSEQASLNLPMKKLLTTSIALLAFSAFAQSPSPQAGAFAEADGDKDGKLSEREYIKMVEGSQKKGSGPKVSRNDLRKTFAKLDKDGDEFLTMAEFAPEKKGSAPKKKGSAPKG